MTQEEVEAVKIEPVEADEKEVPSRKPTLTAKRKAENIEKGLPEDFIEWQDPELVKRADARNALIAALNEVNPGKHHSWALSRSDIELLFGESAIRDGKMRPGYEYKGLPIELEE